MTIGSGICTTIVGNRSTDSLCNQTSGRNLYWGSNLVWNAVGISYAGADAAVTDKELICTKLVLIISVQLINCFSIMLCRAFGNCVTDKS